MQEEVVLRAADDGIQTRHGALHHPRQIGQILAAHIEEIGLMGQRKNVHLPFVTAGKRLDGDEFLAPLDDILAHIDLAAHRAGSAVVDGCLEGQRLVDQCAENAVVMLGVVRGTVPHFGVNVFRHHRHRDHLAVRMRDRRPGSRAEILEHQHVFQPLVRFEQLAHARLIDAEQDRQVRFGHLLYGDAMLMMIDDDFVPAVAVDGLLQAEVEPGLFAVVAQHRIEIFHHADLPVALGRPAQDHRRGFMLVATAERAGFNVFAGVARRQFLGFFRAHAARGGDQHRFARDDRIDADFADFAGFVGARV